MKRFARKATLVGLSLTLITGCGALQSQPSASKLKKDDPVLQALLASANNIETSLKKLANAEHYEKVETRKRYTRVNDALPGLNKTVVLRWDGELEPAIKAITELSDGYRFLPPIGKKPLIPVMVSLPEEPRTLVNLIEHAALQAGNQADVVLDVQQKIIQVRYNSDS